MRHTLFLSFQISVLAFVAASTLYADPVPVRHAEGAAHGFLALTTLDGKRIATGDKTTVVHRGQVTSRLVFHFRDGSIDDETTVFTQSHVFHLISDRHIQRGPFFPKPVDVSLDALTGTITTRTEDGKVTEDHLDLPSDVCNGMTNSVLMNILPSVPETKLSLVAPSTKPRLVHLSIKPNGKTQFLIGDSSRQAIHYVIHIELGGVGGVVAPLIGKQPEDVHLWILGGPNPAFIREEGQTYQGGPILRIQQISPSFPRQP